MSNIPIRSILHESGCLGMQPKMGGKFHLKLNMGTRPIANKYREGKMKSTLKRELKGREAVKMEPFKGSNEFMGVRLFGRCVFAGFTIDLPSFETPHVPRMNVSFRA